MIEPDIPDTLPLKTIDRERHVTILNLYNDMKTRFQRSHTLNTSYRQLLSYSPAQSSAPPTLQQNPGSQAEPRRVLLRDWSRTESCACFVREKEAVLRYIYSQGFSI